jgi:MFS transporter, YNFM family, putative membrane transport protein
MKTSHLLSVLAVTVLAISTLYAPQPILPLFRERFGVSEASAALLITVTMFPLGLAPLAYGFFLESFSSKRMMASALFLLAVTETAIGFCASFEAVLALRFAQGLIIPAMLTAIMTYISSAASAASIRRIMATYIATTTVGGFCGRFFAGQLAAYFDWRAPFFALGASLCAAILLVVGLPPDARPAFERINLGAIPNVLRKQGFFKAYAMAFCIFFVFAAMLNYLPFRLISITGEYSASKTGFMYFGYLMGITSSLFSTRCARFLGGEVRAMVLGVAIMFLSVCLFATPSVYALFVSLFALCTGMFLAHSLAPGALNSSSAQNKGVVNGLYISFYYSGGTLGSYLPGLVQEHFGWPFYVATLFVALTLAMYFAWTIKAQSFDAGARR